MKTICAALGMAALLTFSASADTLTLPKGHVLDFGDTVDVLDGRQTYFGKQMKNWFKYILNTRRKSKMKKTIITVVGKDRVGIIAKVCVYLAENNINILDIAQTIVDGYFNMMMVVNAEAASKDHDRIAEDLAGIGEELGVQIKAQQEEIFDMMHRL